ncbi:MAG: MinD/ParA family ATP-binding protein, partial [Janthinobacterium lividum]
EGTWLFVARPDGTMVETARSLHGSAPAPVGGQAPQPDRTPEPAPEQPAPAQGPPQNAWAGPQPWTPAAPAGGPQPGRPWSPPAGGAPVPPVAPEPGPVLQTTDADPYAAGPRRAVPTLDDLLGGRPAPTPGPAQLGWQAFVRKATFGLVKPGPGPVELRHRDAAATIQRSLPGPRTVVVVNPKGGASKTTATMLLAATFATLRGGYTLAWDNNETRGTLGWRAVPARHTNTAVDLLADLERFQQVRGARVGDLDNYVRSQGAAQFDVLASDEDPAASASIDADAFQRLHSTLSRFYRILVIDTGNNMRASNWEAAVAAADQLVVVSTIREDTAASAAWLVDGLRAKGHGDKVEHAVTILSAPASSNDPALSARLHDHFAQLTRAVVDVPHEQSLVAGGPIDFAHLSKASREAWVLATAKVAEGL